MYLTGFADEASPDLAVQIRATQQLGWSNIEARNVSSANIHDIDEAEFDRACEQLEEAGITINCFGSTIANWAKKITDPFEITLEEVRRAIPRMQRLNTSMVRIMSYAVLKDRGPEDQMEEERFRRLREIHRMFTDAGLTPVHENCNNYGGMGWKYTLRMLENVPGLKLVFDTGNPVFSDDRNSGAAGPYAKQSAWEFYEHVKDHVAYIHIKDGIWDTEASNMNYTHAGEGNGDVRRVVKHMLDNGYDGGISMEPHLAVVFHDESVQSDDEVRYANYVEYGRRFMDLIREIGHGDKLRSVA